jgi:hypothetical protein
MPTAVFLYVVYNLRWSLVSNFVVENINQMFTGTYRIMKKNKVLV